MNQKNEYITRQKEFILSFFKENSNECYTAKDIINNDKIPVGEATVYRQLTRLFNKNLLKKFAVDNKSGTYYQYNDTEICGNHYHLKCIECGSVSHLSCSYLSNMGQHIEENHKFSVDNLKTIIYGRCKNCDINQE